MNQHLLFLATCASASQGIFHSDLISVGPQVHYYIESKTWSVGFETSFWYANHLNPYGTGKPPYVPYSWNLGYEWSKSKQVIYSEAQATWPGLIGLSIGPALIVPSNNKASLTWQGEAWWTFFGGLSYRYRPVDHQGKHSFGAIARLLLESDNLLPLD